MKMINDTLKFKGKWSQKRINTFCCFFVAVIYAFLPVVIPLFDVKEFVFLGFLGAGGYSLFRTQKNNENTNYDNYRHYHENREHNPIEYDCDPYGEKYTKY